MRLVVTGGGSGGHIYPAVAVADYFRSSDAAEVAFIGSAGGPEVEVTRREKIPFVGLELRGVMGKSPPAAARAIYFFLRATSTCRGLFRNRRPDCVIGTGGYASAPACFAAVSMGIPSILHEMNFEPGLVTRLLARRASVVAVAFEGTIALLRKGSNAVVTGVPVRREIEELAEESTRARKRSEAFRQFGLEPGLPTLLVFGGSQGAEALNSAVREAISVSAATAEAQVLHLTGPKAHSGTDGSLPREPDATGKSNYRSLEYCERMDLAYSVADLALTRAGAGTVAELTAARLPAVLVPYPHAAGHQELNARELEARGAAVVVPQEGHSARAAMEAAAALLGDREALGRMRAAIGSLLKTPGTEGIAGLVRELT